MHGCSSESICLVNAEVDSMGGVADGGIGTSLKTSPRQVAIEKAEAELRQELILRKERRRELEFLRKGGNPLDFKCGSGVPVCLVSTSFSDQQLELLLDRDAKGGVSFTAPPHADSVESTGIPGPTVCEPNGVDKFVVDGNNELPKSSRDSLRSGKSNDNAKLELPFKVNGNQNAKDSEDSAIFRPYARRNRSKPNRDGARISSGSTLQSRGGHISYAAHGGSKNVGASASENNVKKGQNSSPASEARHKSSNGCQLPSGNQVDEVPDSERATKEVLNDCKGDLPEERLDTSASHSLRGDHEDQLLEDVSKEPSTNLASEEPAGEDRSVSVVPGQVLCEITGKATEDASYFYKSNDSKGYHMIIPHEGQASHAAVSMKGLDSESCCTQTSLGLDVNNGNYECANPQIVDSSRPSVEKTIDRACNFDGNEMKKEKNENVVLDVEAMHCGDYDQILTDRVLVKIEEDSHADNSGMQNEMQYPSNTGEQEQHSCSDLKNEKAGELFGHNANESSEACNEKHPEPMDVSLLEVSSSGRKPTGTAEFQASGISDLKLRDKVCEDSVLEEARKIEAKRKKITKLPIIKLHVEHRKKSHWDFVLEEMAWLANDFAQERLWKISAASQFCHQASVAIRPRIESQSQHRDLKQVAYIMAKTVMDFWSSVEVHINDDRAEVHGDCDHCFEPPSGVDAPKVPTLNDRASNMMVKGKEEELGCQGIKTPAPILKYAVRFLKYIRAPVPSFRAEASKTPELSWEDKQSEGSLFYTVPSSAMEEYRNSIESYFKSGSCIQEVVDRSMYDAGEEFGYEENVYDEDEGETNSNYFPTTFTTIKSTKFTQKRRKTSRTYEIGANMPYGSYTSGTQQSMLMGKRPPNSVNIGSIPTKRMRTASRQRTVSPYGTGANGVVEAQVRTDASSGDTSSFQDDQSTLHLGSHIQRSVEVESAREFETKLPYDSAAKPKKKKKTKHQGITFEQGWQLESTAPSEQRDNCRKRLENHNLDANGLHGHDTTKKLRTTKQSIDNNFDNIAPIPGSISSPVASQMSNMSNPDKIIKLIGGREKGRKAKVPKMSVVQGSSGCPWSSSEDQALVVLVHDMGPNWELISDAINSTLHFKCIYRKPQECKERHKILMDRSSDDGAESADDSGSAHSYPSTLPGIPKGSARQLFQRLQGPMEEETIKSHFGIIITSARKLHSQKKDKPNPKSIAAVHSSHVVALSQVCPNNLNGTVLRPIDLCDVDTPIAEVFPIAYQGTHGSGLSQPNQGAVASVLPNAGHNSSIHGSSGMVLGNNQSMPPGSLNPSARDGRYGTPRASSYTVEEQQRMQQHNQMLPRNIHQSSLSVAGAVSGTDRGIRMIPGGNGMGMVSGLNRNIAMPRPMYQGMASSSVLNSGSMLSSGMMGMQNTVNVHPGAGPGQGSPVMRSRDPLHTMRPANNPERQRQMMVPDLQMQVTQGNSQGIPPYNGLSSAFPNQTTSPPVQAFPGHTQQQNQIPPQQSYSLSNHHHPTLQGSNHTSGTQQQAYVIRLAKERQIQQRLLRQQRQQQQFATSSTLIAHAQSQPQLPISSSVQNTTQVPSQSTSHVASSVSHTQSSPVTAHPSQHQQKHLSHGLGRNPQIGANGLSNQMGKHSQQQQQQFAQSGRNHPQQRPQSQQLAKVLKGNGRGNLAVQQSLAINTSHLNGLSRAPGNQSAEKGEQIMHSRQGQGYTSVVTTVQPSKPYIPPQSSNHPQMQQKVFSGGTAPSSNQLQNVPSPSDRNHQNHTSVVPSSNAYTGSLQAIPPTIMSSSHQQLPLHPQAHQKLVNYKQPAVQRVPQQNNQANHDPSSKFPTDHAQSTQKSVTSTSRTVLAAPVSQSCAESSKIVPVISDTVSSQWKASEPVYDSSMLNSNPQAGPVGSPPLTNSNGGESMPPVGHGISRQLSGSVPQAGHNAGSQWEQQPPMHQYPTPPSTSQHQSPEQLVMHDQRQSSQQ